MNPLFRALLAAGLLAAPSLAAPTAQELSQEYFSAGWTAADASAAPAPAEAASLPVPWDGPIHVEHSPIAHMYITQQAYALYASRYQGGDLAEHMGGVKGDKPDSDEGDTVVAGSYDEDSPSKNPFNDAVPELRHFWNCRLGWDKGLSGYDSAVNRSSKYFTGGYGLDGKYDKDWNGSGEWAGAKGKGALALYRDGEKGRAFWYLGHAAHLLEDLTVPAHALLFAHPFGLDAYETWAKENHRDWKAPADPSIESYPTLYDIYDANSDAAGAFDAGKNGVVGTDGRADKGSRRKGGFDETKLRQIGDVLMPRAIRSVAALFLHFYKQVDKTPPEVTLLSPASRDENAPDAAVSADAVLRASAADAESGVDRRGYAFEYAVRTETGWTAWRPATFGTGPARAAFALTPGIEYAIRAAALDAAGNRGVSAPGYVTAAPTVAGVR